MTKHSTKYEVYIRKNETGEIRVYHSDTGRDPWSGHDVSLWESGNCSCDCNRSAFFARAAGEAGNIFDDCGETKYDVLKIVLDDGTEVPVNRWS